MKRVQKTQYVLEKDEVQNALELYLNDDFNIVLPQDCKFEILSEGAIITATYYEGTDEPS